MVGGCESPPLPIGISFSEKVGTAEKKLKLGKLNDAF